MQSFKKWVLAMVSIIALTSSLHAADAKKLFINLKSEQLRPAGMGLAIANAMQDAGVKTTVLIGADAVPLALVQGNQPDFGPTGASPREMILSLIKKGGNVMICGMCAKDRQIEKGDVVSGVKIATPTDVYGALFADGTQSLSF